MKRFYILCLIVAALAACQQEAVREDVYRGPVFRAVTEDLYVPTRTSLGEDMSSVWSAGDEIAVFAGRCAMDRYVVDARCSGSSSGVFNVLEEGQVGEAAIAANVAVYPYQAGLVCSVDGDAFRFDGFMYPAVQMYSEGSFAEGAYAMAAVTSGTEDYNLRFKNVGGAIKLQLVGKEAVSRVSVSGNNGERLSGEAVLSVYRDGLAPAVEMSSDAATSVSLLCEDGVQLSLSVPVSFYVAVPPTVFERGFTVEIESAEGEVCTLEASARNVVGRSKILSMPVAKVEFDAADAVEGDYVDEYGANWGQGVVIDGVRWAPVNCGYKEEGVGDKGFVWGKMFQWGRLYGVGYNTTYDSSVADKVAGGEVTVAEANSAAEQNVFYTMDAGNNQSHWFSDTSIEGVWNAGTASEPAKSVYDPCPAGWRLPTQPEMKGLTSKRSAWTQVDGKNGYWFSGSQAYAEGVPAVFFPAAGNLTQKRVGSSRNSFGQYWTSTVRTSDNKVYYLSFSSGNSNVVLTGTVYGCSVRCVAE